MSGPVVVVLAAGRGSRFRGRDHKLAQAFGDSSVLGTTLSHALASQLPIVVVATAALADIARLSVATRDIVILPDADTPGPQSHGMGYSIACGVSARPDASGWLILPGDMPLVKPATLQAVSRDLRHHAVTYAQHHGQRGHPVGFSAEIYSELAALTGDDGARRLVSRYPAHGVEVDDPGVLIDIDTEADLEDLRSGKLAASPAQGRPMLG